MNGEGVTAIFCWTIVCLIVGGAVGDGCRAKFIHNEAISAGVAEHYIDADQNKAFRWKTNQTFGILENVGQGRIGWRTNP
jgi:hypothetical protein